MTNYHRLVGVGLFCGLPFGEGWSIPDPKQSRRLSVHHESSQPSLADVTLWTDSLPSEKPGSHGALSLTVDELTERLGGRGRALIAWDCYSIGVDPHFHHGHKPTIHKDHNGIDFMEDYNDEAERETISQLLPTRRCTQMLGKGTLELLDEINGGGPVENGIATLTHVSRSSDDTTKLLLRLADGMEVETVIIPWNGTRSTLCISSQVGCRQGCVFCATGRMGKLRSLSSDEILVQMFFARKMCRRLNLPRVKNVVFMGMGEPADNAISVTRAVKILTTRGQFQLSATKVTVSTVGPSPNAFWELAKSPCLLAWSVHAVDDVLRRRLVPTTKYSMAELREGFIDALLQRSSMQLRTVMLEVALLRGINDSLGHADALAEFARVIVERVEGCKLVVNLIPYNDIMNGLSSSSTLHKPSQETVVAFQHRLWHNGVFAHIRTTRGDDESAACGQLATKHRKRSKQQEGSQ